jgi:hypothetical protein
MWQLVQNKTLYASLSFAAAGLVRANGILYAGFFIFQLIGFQESHPLVSFINKESLFPNNSPACRGSNYNGPVFYLSKFGLCYVLQKWADSRILPLQAAFDISICSAKILVI